MIVTTLDKPKPIKKKAVNKLNDLTGKEWLPETISVFVQKGLGRGHKDAQIEREHPAPFSFQDVGRLINFFTKKGQDVLDPFSGVASTLKACALSGRNGCGIELAKRYCDLSKKRLKIEIPKEILKQTEQKIINGNALKKITDFEDNSFDFIVTSPPYWNILNKVDHKVKQERIGNWLDIKYSISKNDIGNIESYPDFIEVLSHFFEDCSRILKPKKYLCIIVSDFRHKSKYYMFHSDLANRLQRKHYTLKGITILYQKFKRIFPYGFPYSYVPNIHHQYILILENEDDK